MHSRFLLLLLAFTLSSNSIQAELKSDREIISKPSKCVASQEGLPTSIVNGSVCAITGEFLDTQTDLILPGPQPLILQRTYNSGNNEEGSLENSWEFCFPSRVSLKKQYIDEMYYKYPAYFCDVVLTEASGAKLSYYGRRQRKVATYPLDFNVPSGFTNCASGELSARTHLKNQTLLVYNGCERIDVEEPNGDKRTYRLNEKKEDDYSLVLSEHFKMNRQKLYYEYDKHSLSFIQGEHWNGPVYNRLDFQYSLKKDQSWTLSTSDGRKLKYSFEKHNKVYYLTSIKGAEHPDENYEYVKKFSANKYHISKKILPNNRYVKNTYYVPGKNYIGQCEIDIPSSDKRIDRVKMQEAPLGTDASPIIAYQYVYHPDLKWQAEIEGITRVIDALGGMKEYQYDNEQRLTAIDIYTGRYGAAPFQRHSMVRYFLGAKHIDAKNNLLTKTFEDGSGRMQEAHGYWYDQAGNVISERLFGNLSGHSPVPPFVDASGNPPQNGCENYGSQYAYSQDCMHLPIMELADNGKKILTSYLPNTNITAGKLLLDHDRIIRREFFEYNHMDVLSKIIVDDGCMTDPHDLTGVTLRKITYTFTRTAMPYGLIERKVEKYLDLATGQEKLLGSVLYNYSKQGRLLKEDHYDADDLYRYCLEWDYDAHGNVTREINAQGYVTVFQYDANDNLTFKKSYAHPYCTHYAYDYSDRLISEKEIHTDGNCFVTTHRYDYLHNRIATVDSYGNETRYIYDDLSRLIQTIGPSVIDDKGNFAPITEEYNYDIYNCKTFCKDACGRETRTQYNIRGKPVTINYPDGTVEQFVYNLDGTLKKATAANGTYTEYTYDVLGRVTKEQIYSADMQLLSTKSASYNGFQKTSSTDAEGITTYYQYDGAGRFSSTTTGDQNEIVEYDSLGRLKKVKTLFGSKPEEFSVKAYEYDLLNHVTEERIEDHLGKILSKVTYTYDASGNRTEIHNYTASGNSCTKLAYNGLHQITNSTDALGNTTSVHYDYQHLNQFNQKVLQITTIDALGNQTINTNDASKRLVSVEHKNAMGTTTAQQQIFYDRVGNRTKTIDTVLIEGIPQKQIVTAWEYNNVNQVLHLTEAVGTPEQKDTRYSYNNFGQKSTLLKPDGIEIYYTYDPQGLLQTVTSSDKSIDYSYVYNRNHEPLEVTDSITGTATQRKYNQNGLLESEDLAHGQTVQYGYDRSARVKTVALSDEITWQYTYDAAFLRQVDRLQQGEILYSHTYQEYDLSGLLSKSILPKNIGEIEYKHDLLKRVNHIKSPHWNYSDAEYDAVGNLSNYVVKDSFGVVENRFTYDDLYHIKTEKGHATHTYQSDSLHNRTLKDQTQYKVNSLNQLTEQGASSYQYDPNGNLIAKIQNGRLMQYHYDAFDRLIEVICENDRTSYLYDAFNRRLSKSVNGNIEKYLYQGQNEIGASVNGQITELRLLGLGKGAEIGAAIACEFQQQLFVPLHDYNGNVVTLLNQAGEVAESYRYSAFGERTIFDAAGTEIAVSQIGNGWCFASKRYDVETGFVYFGRRHYDPEIGRWLTPDPIGYADGPNLYAYLQNNPLNAIDLYGLERDSRNHLDGPRNERIHRGENSQRRENVSKSESSRETVSRNNEDTNKNSVWSNIGSALAGMCHGAIDFVAGSLHDIHASTCLIGTQDIDTTEMHNTINAVYDVHAQQMASIESKVMGAFSVNNNNAIYSSGRSKTRVGLEIGSLVTGVYSLCKGVMAFSRIARFPLKMPQLALPINKVTPKVINVKPSVIHVTPQGVAIPPGTKYQIPTHYVENTKRAGSYGESINGVFIEKLRIDPATLPEMKGPNYSHYHISGKSKHNSPLPGAPDPGFSP